MRSVRWAALLLFALAAPALADPPSLVTLSKVLPTELITRFNADAAHARLLVMLSPT
jgi:hypothetical protein